MQGYPKHPVLTHPALLCKKYIKNPLIYLGANKLGITKHLLKGTRYINENGINENIYSPQLDSLKIEQSHREIDLSYFCSTPNLSDIKELLKELIKDKNLDDLLFTTRKNTPYTPNNFIRRHFNPLLKELGLENSNLTPQVFRQYFFAKGVNSGIDEPNKSEVDNYSKVIEFSKKRLLREKRIREKDDPLGSFLSDMSPTDALRTI